MLKLIVGERAKKELSACDKRTKDRYERLIESILKDPFHGIGKPEKLKHIDNAWSRRVDDKNRLVYRVKGTSIEIISILTHYKKLKQN